MNKKIIVSLVVSLSILLVTAIIDLSLQLGNFSGLVFFLYSFYGLGILIILFLLFGIFKNKTYFYSIIPPIILLLVLFIASNITN